MLFSDQPYCQPLYQPCYQPSWPQLAHVLLEGMRAEVRRSGGGGLAARLAVAALQVDNQLVTSARPVVLAAAQQVRPPAARYLPPPYPTPTTHHTYLNADAALHTCDEARPWSEVRVNSAHGSIYEIFHTHKDQETGRLADLDRISCLTISV